MKGEEDGTEEKHNKLLKGGVRGLSQEKGAICKKLLLLWGTGGALQGYTYHTNVYQELVARAKGNCWQPREETPHPEYIGWSRAHKYGKGPKSSFIRESMEKPST